MTAMRLRTVLTWVDMIQFDMAKQVLEAEGIPFDTFGWNTPSLEDPTSVFVANRPSLRVGEEHFEQARAAAGSDSRPRSGRKRTVGQRQPSMNAGSAIVHGPPLSSAPCSTRRRP